VLGRLSSAKTTIRHTSSLEDRREDGERQSGRAVEEKAEEKGETRKKAEERKRKGEKGVEAEG